MFGKVCHRIDGIDNPIATREDVFQTGPSSADPFRPFPSEAAILASYMAIPPQIATGYPARYPGNVINGLCADRINCIDNPITAGEYVLEAGPSGADFLPALPSKSAVIPSEVTIPNQIAVWHDGVDKRAGPGAPPEELLLSWF
jgi:hypothetical protein